MVFKSVVAIVHKKFLQSNYNLTTTKLSGQGAWLKSFMELNIEQRREAARNGDKARVGMH